MVLTLRRAQREDFIFSSSLVSRESGAAAEWTSLWRTPIDVKRSHPKASVLRRGRVVFNIKANDYRLVAQINYQAGTVEIRFFGTHAECDEIDAQTV